MTKTLQNGVPSPTASTGWKEKIVYSLSHQIMESICLWKMELKKVSKINHGESGLRSSLLYNPIHVITYKHWNFTSKKSL